MHIPSGEVLLPVIYNSNSLIVIEIILSCRYEWRSCLSVKDFSYIFNMKATLDGR